MSIWASSSHKTGNSLCCDKLLAMGSGIRRRTRENANDLKPNPGTTLHNMIVEGMSMHAALKEKLQPILAPKG